MPTLDLSQCSTRPSSSATCWTRGVHAVGQRQRRIHAYLLCSGLCSRGFFTKVRTSSPDGLPLMHPVYPGTSKTALVTSQPMRLVNARPPGIDPSNKGCNCWSQPEARTFNVIPTRCFMHAPSSRTCATGVCWCVCAGARQDVSFRRTQNEIPSRTVLNSGAGDISSGRQGDGTRLFIVCTCVFYAIFVHSAATSHTLVRWTTWRAETILRVPSTTRHSSRLDRLVRVHRAVWTHVALPISPTKRFLHSRGLL